MEFEIRINVLAKKLKNPDITRIEILGFLEDFKFYIMRNIGM